MSSVSIAQYGTVEWIHPRNNFEEIDSSSYVHVFGRSHIVLIDFADSLDIFEHNYGLKYNKRVGNGVIKFNVIQNQVVTKILEADYSLNIQNNYSEVLLLGYVMEKGIFSVDLEMIKYSGVNEISPSLLFSARLRPWLKLSLGRAIYSNPFNLSINYTDFIYIMNGAHTDHERYHYGISFMGERYIINCAMESDVFEINSNDSSPANIEINTGIKRKMYLNGALYLNNNRKIDWFYYKNYNQIGLDLYNDSEESFFTINKYENENYVFSLGYQFNLKEHMFNIALFQREMDFSLSNRIQPNFINTDLELFFNDAIFVNNADIGKIEQRAFSARLSPNIPFILSPTLQIDWLIDHYYMNMSTNGWVLGLPMYVDNQNQKIIGKEALNIRLEMVGKFNHWSLSVFFSQHIPYKIITTDEIYVPSDYTEGEKRKEKMYGGGLFNISLIRYLD